MEKKMETIMRMGYIGTQLEILFEHRKAAFLSGALG